LAQSKPGSERGEVAHWYDTNEIEEQADKTSVDESEEEKSLREKTDGK
jgi:hypothetical protein